MLVEIVFKALKKYSNTMTPIFEKSSLNRIKIAKKDILFIITK